MCTEISAGSQDYYRCADYGSIFRALIDPHLKEDAQYGSELQALILAQINSENVAINKVASFMNGITHGEIAPSEGYIAKLQKKELPKDWKTLKMICTASSFSRR